MSPLSQTVHEKLAVIATFAYSHGSLVKMRERFNGPWPFLEKIIFDLPRQEALKALKDFALNFRDLDNKENLTDYWKETGEPSVGTIFMKDGTTKRLSPREMSNKIIHSKQMAWDFSGEPQVICEGEDQEKWVRAVIDVKRMLWIGAQLGS
jgi:hypothetical protein